MLALAAILAVSALTLAPAKAQTPGPPASIEISEPSGSLSLGSAFQLTATITDASGNPVSDGTAVTWPFDPDPPGILIRQSSLTSTTAGKTYAVYIVSAAGMPTITVTSGSVSATRLLRTGESSGTQPPDPSSISLDGGPDTARTAGRFTATATITDGNGAPVPDDTPVTWEMAAARGADAVFTPVSVERVTVNGTASATYTVTSSSSVGVLATARSGSARFTLLFGVPLTWPSAAAGVTLTSSVPSWKLLKIGETVTLTATANDANGAAVSDGTSVVWIPPSTALSQVSADAVTASGSASATYRVVGASPGLMVVIVDVTGTGTAFVYIGNIGAYPEPPDDLALSLHLPADSDNIIPADSTLRVGTSLTYTGQVQRLNVSDGTLRVAGAQEWESGRSRLTIASQATRTQTGRIVPVFFGSVQQSATRIDPDTCKGISLDGQTGWTCTVELDNATIHIPAGTPDGTFTISGVITVNGREYRDTLEVTVSEIDEVADVQLDFAEQERGANRGEPYPADVPVGGETKLRLKILNENGAASAAGSIGAITLSTTVGTLSTRIGGGCTGGGGSACQIPISAVTAANADQIDVILTHPGPNKSGRGEVRASVLALDGGSFSPPALTVTFAGEAASLAISEPAGSLLNIATDEDDHRDLLKLIVSAADAAGNNVDLPYRSPRAIIRDPDDKVVTSGIRVTWTEDGDDADSTHDRFTRNTANAVEATIRTTAAAEAPLKPGLYTLELRTDGKTATREFTIVGGTDSVALSEPTGELQVEGAISFTATLRDADGNPVPDGTPVAWAERSTGQSAVLVLLTPNGVTTDGMSTAKFVAVGSGTAVVSAGSGGVQEIALLTITLAPTAGAATDREPQLSDNLSSRGAPGIATWLGATPTSTSALLDALSEINTILLWRHEHWQRHSRGDADATDFIIDTGTVLWLGR